MQRSLVWAAAHDAFYLHWDQVGRRRFAALVCAFGFITLVSAEVSLALALAGLSAAFMVFWGNKKGTGLFNFKLHIMMSTMILFYASLMISQWVNLGGPVQTNLASTIFATPILVASLTVNLKATAGNDDSRLLSRPERRALAATGLSNMIAILEIVRIQLSSNFGPLHILSPALNALEGFTGLCVIGLALIAILALSRKQMLAA